MLQGICDEELLAECITGQNAVLLGGPAHTPSGQVLKKSPHRSAIYPLLANLTVDFSIRSRYTKLFWDNQSGVPAVDVRSLKQQVPLPRPDPGTPPVFVLGGDTDFTVDIEGLHETAEYYNIQPVIVPKLAHDVMLVSRVLSDADLFPAPYRFHRES